MKRTFLFTTLILLSTIFVAPAKAGSTPAGTVIRCNRSYRADYVATDGKRYPFANAYVYYTWYYNLAPVKVIPCADFDRIPEGGGQITARPGAKLVKFDGSNDLYVVTVGAVLRKLPNTDMAKTYYGNYHAYYTITLPQINKSSYRIGEPITDVAQFSRGEEMLKTATIDQELVFRGLISVPVPTPTQTPTPTPTPVALSTDATLSLLALNTGTPLSPVFNAATTRYTVTVPNNQTQFIVSAKTNHPRATLRVNEGLFANGQGSVTQSLLVGANISTIIVTAEDRVTQKVYYITTTREAAPTPPSPAPTPAPTPSPTPTTPPTPAPQPSAGSLTLSTIITEATFNAMFPNRSYSGCNGSVFTYASFIEAARSYPRFASEGSDDVRKREVAAFLAQISHETTGGWATAPGGPYAWGLCFREEVGCERGGCAAYCDPSNSKYQCVAGKNYHGRGPMQLSWNYNYGAAGEALGLNLLQNPDQVATNGTVAFKTALWFWMTAQPPKPSAHDVMTGAWTPSTQDVTAGRLAGYGMTTNIINGGLECQQPTDARVRDRVGFFQTYAQRLNVTTGNNLYCDQMRHY